MSFVAHTPLSGAGEWHSLVRHLEGTARRAEEFGRALGLGVLVHAAALLHDVGKYSDEFQRFLRQCHRASLTGQKVPTFHLDHKSAGALRAFELCQLLALPILGHHGELPSPSDAQNYLKRACENEQVRQSLARARADLEGLDIASSRELTNAVQILAASELDTEVLLRMLYSCLVDADAADTETHWQPDKAAMRGPRATIEELWTQLEADQQRLIDSSEGTPVNLARRAVYEDCLQAAKLPQGVFKLTVPTGGGKTRSSLAFALRHAALHGLNRVIYAIPYTSIIEQTADVFRGIFQDPYAVLEHHSAIPEPEEDADGAATDPLLWQRLAAEDWNTPLIVTTTVQFFESLFAARPGRCRKVHRIARSVIILDEVQTLPLRLLTPTLDMLRTLVERYGTTVVLCTATQPALDSESRYLRGLPTAQEIVRDPGRHFDALQRVEYRVEREPWQWERVAKEMHKTPQCLTVVNTRKDALALIDALGDAGAKHLSTLLCGAHRREVLAEVRHRLREGLPCRLVSTQVVEAGVDLDFPRVLRAWGPLDSIVQTAGRCNREGRLGCGQVTIFEPAEGSTPPGSYRVALSRARIMLTDPNVQFHEPEIFTEYFRKLFQDVNTDAEGIQHERKNLRFPEVADKFRIIPDETIPVLVPYDKAKVEDVISRAQESGRVSRELWRRAHQHSVSLYRRDFDRWRGEGAITEVPPDSSLYRWLGGYDKVRGLTDVVSDPSELVV